MYHLLKLLDRLRIRHRISATTARMMIADASNSDTHIAITAVMILKLMITKIAAAMEIADRIRVVIVTAEIPVSAPKPRSEPKISFSFFICNSSFFSALVPL